MTINMLNLPKLNILDVTESEDDYRLLVETISSLPSHCPKCGTVANLYKHGKKKQLFFDDLPMHAKRVGIYIKRQRYKCRECNETFFETLSDMDVNRSVTNRLIDWIQQASLEKTVRNIFNDYVAELEAQTEFRTPKWLGLDEVHLLKK